MNHRKYTVIDLFAGCGGLSLGFEMAGFDVQLAIDNWEDALITYRHNHKNTKTLKADLLNLDPASIENDFNLHNVDVIIGGPPCQGFSVAGKRIIEDDRNKLYKSFVRFVDHFKPQAFVMENVPNILSIGNGAVREAIIEDFSKLGYDVVYKVLTASDYGVPQNRRRAIFVGLLKGTYIFPEATTALKRITVKEAISDLPEDSVNDGGGYPLAPQSDYQRQMRKNSTSLNNHQITEHSDETKRIIAMVPDGCNYKCLPQEMWSLRKVHIAWTRMDSKKPCFTIDTGHYHHFHYSYNRVPTVRESARIQSFPDDFLFIGGKGSQLKQVGNAVPPLMAYSIANQLFNHFMTYIPEHQYRCTIIRGKSQSDMEDLLPLYANMVHKFCPCTEDEFNERCNAFLSKNFYDTSAYDKLPDSKRKTVRNHITEIACSLLGLYYPQYDEETGKTYINESESCKYLVQYNDLPTFFKNLCLNFQFPNGAKKFNFIIEDLDNNINLKPFCYVVSLLYYAQSQKEKVLLTKQEIGYYVLNNLDVLQGRVSYKDVYHRIISDRQNGIKRESLSGSYEWQHIKEQFNLLELANIIETDATYIWLNKYEANAIALFIKNLNNFGFDAYSYRIGNRADNNYFISEWGRFYGSFNKELLSTPTQFGGEVVVVGKEEQKAQSGATKSTVDLGDEGEALVFRLEQDRVRKYKERLVNKVLLLGKTKGLGYDISSIEADSNPSKPLFTRYIEVKSTKRVTEPSFDKKWLDTLNITSKEWVAAEQHGDFYNIYRVYFTKTKTLVVRIQNPFKMSKEGRIEVYPTIYQMNFGSSVIERLYCIDR